MGIGVGCRKGAAEESRSPSSEANDQILAEFSGHPIRRSDLQPALGRALERAGPEHAPSIELRLLRAEIDRRLIRARAESLGVQPNAEEVEARWRSFVARFGGKSGFDAYLERSGTTAEQERRRLEDEAARERVFDNVGAAVEIQEADIRRFYDEHPELFERPGQNKLRHLFLRVPDPKGLEAAQARLQALRATLEAGEAKLEDLARAHGEDGSRAKGGLLGWVAEGQLGEAFDRAVEGLEVGEVSAPVKTELGLHLIQKLEERPPSRLPFEDVKSSIGEQIHNRRRARAIERAIAAWRSEAGVRLLGPAAEAANAETSDRGRDPSALAPRHRRPEEALRSQRTSRSRPRVGAPDPETGPPKM